MVDKVIEIKTEADLIMFKFILPTDDLTIGDRVTQVFTSGGVTYLKVNKASTVEPLVYARMLLNHGGILGGAPRL